MEKQPRDLCTVRSIAVAGVTADFIRKDKFSRRKKDSYGKNIKVNVESDGGTGAGTGDEPGDGRADSG